MTFLTKHIESLLSMDLQTLVVLAMLCAMAAYFIKDYLANPTLIIFVYPVLVLCSILVQYLFIRAELYPPKKLDEWLMWTIIASIIGTIVGTSLVAAIAIYRDRPRRRQA
jgi:uncharacterized membrane protein